MISGFVLGLNYKDDYKITTFYKKRINKLLIPYLIWSVIYISIDFKAEGFSLSEIIFKLLTGDGYYHLWFFFLIFQLYFLFPFFRKILNNRGFILLATLLIIQIAFSYFTQELADEGYFLPIIKKLFLTHIFYFGFGIWIADNLTRVENILSGIKTKANILFFAITVFSSYLFSFNWLALNNYFFDYSNTIFLIEKITLPVIFILIMINLYSLSERMNLKKFSLINETIPKYSFGIYLSHALILRLIIKVLKIIEVTPEDISFYLLSFSGTLLLSVLFCYIVEKTPISKYLISVDRKIT